MGSWDSEPGSRFGALVREYRREAGLTQQELAAKAGLSVAALRDIEQSRRRRPRPSSLAALSDALRLDPENADRLVSAGRGLVASRPLLETRSVPNPGSVRNGQ